MVIQQIDNIREHYYLKQPQDATCQKQIAELCKEVFIHVEYSVDYVDYKI